jgi:lysine biosynthesis protein LysW
MWECEDCGSESELDPDVEEGQIVECLECGAEYEVSCLDPLQLEVLVLPLADMDDDGDGDEED